MRHKLLLLAIALACLLLLTAGTSVADSEPGTITTYAGKGVGDGGPATSASLYHPWGVALDSADVLYIADRDNHLIHKVDGTSGTITTVAGSGSQSYSGDNGPATSAGLYDPSGVAVDSAGNLYFADTTAHRIRKVDTSGIITTVAGSGVACGTLGDGGPALDASLCGPRGVALDSAGNLYFADTYNHRIRMVDTSGDISTFAGNGTPGYSGDNGPATSASLKYPMGVALDSAENLYIADTDNHRIRRVDDTTEEITLVAGTGAPGYSGDNGPATSASLYHPYGLALDSSGDLYIADTSNHRIRKVDTLGIITTVAGDGSPGYSGDDGPATSAGLYLPSGVALDSAGDLYIADFWDNRIRKVDISEGIITTVAGNGGLRYSGDEGPAVRADLNLPVGAAPDGAGNLYIVDYANNRIRKVDTAGEITTVAGNGTPTGSIDGEGGNPSDDLGDEGPATSATLYYPSGAAVDSAGNLYIADSANNRIRKVDTEGVITTVAGNGIPDYAGDEGPATSASLDLPWDVALDSAGNLYIADYNNHRVRKVDTSGDITTVAGTGTPAYSGDDGPAISADLYGPAGVTLDGAGNLYIADSWNHRVRKVNTSGIITTFAGDGTAGYSGNDGPATSARIRYPHGLGLDSAGNLYIADSGNHCIRKVDTEGIITTFAGDGVAGYSGDGGLPASARLNRARDVALDRGSNLYIADYMNHRIRSVILPRTPVPVGGVAEFSDIAESAGNPSPLLHGALAGLAAGGALVLALGAWRARRRWRADC